MMPNGYRGIIFTESHLTMLISYRKSRSGSGFDGLIPKALPHQLSCLLMMHLAMIVPTAIALAEYRYRSDCRKEAVSTMKYFLFHNLGRKLTPTRFGRALREKLTYHAGYDLGISDWRHLNTCIGRFITSGCANDELQIVHSVFDDCDEDDASVALESAMSEQSGHTMATARMHYARLFGAPAGLTSFRFETMLRVSKMFHRFFKFPDPHESCRLWAVATKKNDSGVDKVR